MSTLHATTILLALVLSACTIQVAPYRPTPPSECCPAPEYAPTAAAPSISTYRWHQATGNYNNPYLAR